MSKVIKVDLSKTFEKLHARASERAHARASGIKIQNLAFDDSGKFLGEGNYVIKLTAENPDKMPKKGEFFNAAKVYVQYFAGPAFVNELKPETLGELRKDTDIKEHTDIDYEFSLIENLFQNGETLNEVSAQPDKETDKESGKETGSDDTDPTLIGYALTYAIHRSDEDQTTVEKNINKKLGFFDGVLADLRNITITVNGQDAVKLGKIFDPDVWKHTLGYPDIDANTITRDLHQVWYNDFPNAGVIFDVYSTSSLANSLRRQNKLTLEIKRKLMKTELAICALVRKNDLNYENYNKKVVAMEVTKAIGEHDRVLGFIKPLNFNKISPDDVILVQGYESEKKYVDPYKRPEKNTSGDPNQTPLSQSSKSSGSSGGTEKTKADKSSKSVSESEFKSFILESLICDLFSEEETDKESAENKKTNDAIQKIELKFAGAIENFVTFNIDKVIPKRMRNVGSLPKVVCDTTQVITDFLSNHGFGSTEEYAKLTKDFSIMLLVKRPPSESERELEKYKDKYGNRGENLFTDNSVKTLFDGILGYSADIIKISGDSKTSIKETLATKAITKTYLNYSDNKTPAHFDIYLTTIDKNILNNVLSDKAESKSKSSKENSAERHVYDIEGEYDAYIIPKSNLKYRNDRAPTKKEFKDGNVYKTKTNDTPHTA